MKGNGISDGSDRTRSRGNYKNNKNNTTMGGDSGVLHASDLPLTDGSSSNSNSNSRSRSRSRKSSGAAGGLLKNPPLQANNEAVHANIPAASHTTSNNGTLDVSINNPDPQVVDVVARHLIRNPTNSLHLQGGDITRDLYKWTNEHPSSPSQHQHQQQTQPALSTSIPSQAPSFPNRKRSMSFSAASIASSSQLNNHTEANVNLLAGIGLTPASMTHEEMRAPGGFRRSFIIQKHRKNDVNAPVPNFFTRNFIEFLTLYGHFAGEDLSEEEEEEEEEEETEGEHGPEVFEEEALETESTQLISREHERRHHKSSTVKAVLLLLKSFVGTGVLFLPKAFHNGGWGFSALCLLSCALVSYWCFVSLITTKDKVGVDGYGDMGRILYGPKMKFAILSSIALSQIGFSAAYAVFTATNLQVFCENFFHLEPGSINLATYIFAQVLIFVPLSLTRNIAKLSGTALIADLFILLGLVYVYVYSTYYITVNGIASDTMLMFNKADWSLFIGTAIFTFEGIGLLIPIQESMKHPEHFRPSLSAVMCIVAVVFISCGLLCYAAFGADVKTVVLLNFPQDSSYTLTVQLLYALAILLSTPLQLFPAIRILENWTFPSNASGKHNPKVKWLKNYFRCAVVLLTSILAWVGANDLDKFVSLVGSFACIPLIYIYPPLLHYKASSVSGTSRTKLLLDLIVIVFGVVVMAYTSWQTIIMWSK
ncbi:avt3p [Saccharomyces arboricola H-6]|uniref:Avt3p n=1 Tax=Saccharomyces arboricola (strain H-6 / AS 2.3317 / CBS 10644) TaxID=1160507 RepID=J8Q5Q5_SACAR|nr:avt3p [Saccharomyces arboricola H-6]